MGYHYQRKASARIAPKRTKTAGGDEWQNPNSHASFGQSPGSILHLQRTIGNQAVQRLMLQRSPDSDAIQRDTAQPADSRGKKPSALPSFVATITGSLQGKLQSKSRIAGHEGKIELQGLTLEPNKKGTRVKAILIKEVNDLTPAFQKAYNGGESLPEAQFLQIRRNDRGDIETVKTMDFKNGVVAGIQYYTFEGVPMESIEIEFILKDEKATETEK
jgi:type VI protein secretion system component Hcp